MARTGGNPRFRAHLPWPVRLLVVAAIMSGLYVGLWRLLPHGHRSWQEAAITGAVQGLVVFGVVTFVAKLQGGPAARRAAQKALRRKRIPEDVDPSVVRRGLEGSRKVARQARLWGTGALALITVAAAVVAALRGGGLLWWAVAPPAVLTVVTPLLFARQLGRVDQLLTELDPFAP